MGSIYGGLIEMNCGPLSRRELFCLGAVGSLALVPASARAAAGADGGEQLDHLALGVNDLEKGTAYLEAELGVRLTIRNHHPGQGTRMMGLPLGNRQYLELLAPDPGQPGIENPLLSTVRKYRTPTVIGWAAAAGDIEVLAARLQSGGYEFENGETLIVPADGERWSLQWMQVKGYLGGVVPWLVGSSPSSAYVSVGKPSGCQLLELKLEHPRAEKINNLFKALKLRARVTSAPVEKVTARLRTPKGEVVLVG
jgi:glyoxalase-like protein